MLKQRVITALVLLAILIPALAAASPWPFAALTLLFIGAAGWEWARLNDLPGAGALCLGCLVATGGAWALYSGLAWQLGGLQMLWLGAVLAWVLGGALALRGGGASWAAWPKALRWVIGVALLWLAWGAMAAAKQRGLNFLLSVFCLVWAADVVAYFGGRAFGKRKLAPSISPGKSWEGVWSGQLGTLLVAFCWMSADQHLALGSDSIYTVLQRQLGVVGLIASVLFLAGMSVVGDLFESLIKRQAGAKDSSALLPGHGGVLDRIDALLPTLPIAMYLVSLNHV